ncbi:TIGR00282 family metallophosphoesterase [Mesoplasma chauliocola]|uniref:TIGR00282 family metallophosphoesterase n=1 Tax=Mesoplasma chauliocola TaxID=216427 RepID=A0A249SMU3_9MOLU|nr:TIGR00282 family metallophosphoesterase [Mesoplasma chauliocola]ASZ08995.1 TIGR00282 family metallophosphoesterase [Mesoplasma chauliocola]
MRILMIGDIFAKPGRDAFKKHIAKLIESKKIDFVVVNGENTTHGKSISKEHYNFYKQNSVDVITSGNHIFKNPEVLQYISQTPDLLKPMNMYKTPGNGYVIVQKNNKKICVLNLMGNNFMDPSNSVYESMEDFLNLKLNYDILLVDFHAETTAEKIAFALNYDGIITGFVGTHTHVQTADERILPKGTAFITDLGMSGVIDSVIGIEPSDAIYKQKTGLIKRFQPANGIAKLNGVIIEINENTNKAISIERISI